MLLVAWSECTLLAAGLLSARGPEVIRLSLGSQGCAFCARALSHWVVLARPEPLHSCAPFKMAPDRMSITCALPCSVRFTQGSLR